MDDIVIPKAFQKVLMNGEKVLAVTRRHKLWIPGWWLHPIHFILGSLTLGLLFLYTLHIKKNEVIIVTNKKILGSICPKLFTKDKIELPFKSVDNIQEDETFCGNIFGWTAICIESRSESYKQRMLTKNSVKAVKSKFYELQG